MAKTIEDVKIERPMVKVLLLGKAHPAKLSGSDFRVATATICGGPRAFEQYEFPWEMVADSITTGVPLTPLKR